MSKEKNVSQVEQNASPVTAKPTWHRPTVTRIDMKFTTAFPLGSGGPAGPEFANFGIGIK